MNKKGFGKILESVIAILLILAFINYFTIKVDTSEPAVPVAVRDAQNFILEQISTESSLRDCVLLSPSTGDCASVCSAVNTFVRQNTPPGYKFACEMCSSASTCSSNLPSDVSLFTDSVFLSGSNAKVVRIYFWRR